MISRVAIKNFKSIGEPGVDLEFKPLTLLVGPNGGGKSSILEAIALAVQGELRWELVKFEQFSDIVHKGGTAACVIDLFLPEIGQIIRPDFRVTVQTAGGLRSEILSENVAKFDEIREAMSVARQQTFLLSSVRGNLPYSVEARGSPRWVGGHGDDLLLLLALIFGQRRHKPTAQKIAGWSQRFGVADLHAGFHGGTQSASDYLDPALNVALNASLSSSGARQMVTLITQLFWAPMGSLLMIEEPEISLHPKAQIDVLEMFAEAIKRENKQIIATTHSHFLLQALGYAVHKGWLSTNDMVVYHVEKGKTGTNTKPLPLGKNGYLRGWVPSYSKVERELLQEWAKTLPRA